jgi:hypothetical protein
MSHHYSGPDFGFPAVCSKKCGEHFKAREEGDRRWLGRLQAAFLP